MLDGLQLDPVAFSIGNFDIFWYGILISVGIAIGAWWAGREIERRGESSDQLYNGLLIVVIAGYIFARLGYVLQDELTSPGTQYSTFLEVVNIRAGGANIVAGFIGAALVGAWYLRNRKLNLWHYADVAGPTILIAQAIGRWGNFINQELYGPPTTQPWGILIDQGSRLPEFAGLAADTRFHPTFMYESITLLLGFFISLFLISRFRDRWAPGTIFGLFLIWWGGNRAWIEIFRPDQPNIGNTPLTYAMLGSIGIVIAGIFVLLSRYDKLPQSQRAKKRGRVRKPKRVRSTNSETQPETE